MPGEYKVDDDYTPSNPNWEAEKKLIEKLQTLGLTLNEARILVFLMTRGNSSAAEVSRHTGIQRTETYNYISELLKKGIVFSTFDRPQRYYAQSIEEAIDSLVQTKQNALQRIIEGKNEMKLIVESILSNTVTSDTERKEAYQIVMGENSINAKIKRMLADAKEEVTVLVTDRNLVNFYHAEITDQLMKMTAKGIHVKLRTPHKDPMKLIAGEEEGEEGSDGGREARSEAASQEISLKTTAKIVPVNFVLVDNRDIILLLESQSQSAGRKSEQCGFYTNNMSMIAIFRFIFENLT